MTTITTLPRETLLSTLHAMEGTGYYNDHSQIQHHTIPYALPFLRRAASSILLPDHHSPVVIADYGSSQGNNSLQPMTAAITIMRGRMIEHLPIAVIHNDLPNNDFSSLFQSVESRLESYQRGTFDVFSYAIGRSFYDRLFPDDQVSLGWSAWAVQWLSTLPAVIPDHFWYARATGSVAAEFRQQAKLDWDRFLWHRSHELHSGGYLLVHAPVAKDEGVSGWDMAFDLVNTVLQEMVEQHLLYPQEYARMTLPAKIRTLGEYQAPFFTGTMKNTLRLEDYSITEFPDPLWAHYEGTQNSAEYAEAYAGVLFAFLAPSLFGMLDASRTSAERIQLKNAFYEQLRFAIQLNLEIGNGSNQVVTLLIHKRM